MARDCCGSGWFLYYVVLPAGTLYLFARYVFGLTKSKFDAFLIGSLCGYIHRVYFSREKSLLFDQMFDLKKKSKNGLSVLEIGVGSGLNLAFYPEDTKVTALDPNPHNEAYLRASVEKTASHVELVAFVRGFAENMSTLEDDSFDVVVCTLTLCTVRDPAAVLAEVRRVLKPGGTFFYLEHVAGQNGSFTRRVQDVLQHIWPSLSSGCNINRETWTSLDESGLRDVQYRHFNIDTRVFFFARPCLYGTAVK